MVFILNSNAQDISSDFYPSQIVDILNDFGAGWAANSFFKPYQWEDLQIVAVIQNNQFPSSWLVEDLNSRAIYSIMNKVDKPKKLICNAWPGILLRYSDGNGAKFQNGSATLNGYYHFSYGNHFRAWFYPRISTNQNSLSRYTGKPRPNRRAGFNTGEIDMAGIGYFGDWAQVWFGRGRQNWGALPSDNLALSEKSAAFDHATLQFEFNNIHLRYFHGFLEIMENKVHRYITGRGIEYNNKRSLIIGVHEVTIYSGVDRPLDIAYLNPISTHIEIELNQRDNRPGGTGGQNAVWQISTDWNPINKLRLSGNFLVDELVIDDFEREAGQSHIMAFQCRISWSDFNRNFAYTVFSEITRVGTHTFRHEEGGNNFVSRGLPLGTEIGSDGDRLIAGVRLITPWRSIATISAGKERSGERTIINNPYESNIEHLAVPFLSGNVEGTIFLRWEIYWIPKPNIRISLQSQIADNNSKGNRDFLIISFDAYIPFFFEI